MPRPKKVEEGAIASDAVTRETKAQKGDTFDDYVAWAEGAKLADGVVVTRLTHPDAPEHVHPGRYSSFPTSKGNASVTWSDGTTE